MASKASNESFHSTHSHQQPDSPRLTSVTNHESTDLHSEALKAAGIPIYNLDAYLSEARSHGVLNSTPVKLPPPKKQKLGDDSSSSSYTPLQLGTPKTTHNIAALHQLCQERGLRPEFEIDGDQAGGFGGMVTVNGQTIASEQRWKTKKEVKEGLAELAVSVVAEMEAVGKGNGEKGKQEKNWVGLLLGKSPTSNGNLKGPFLFPRHFPLAF